MSDEPCKICRFFSHLSTKQETIFEIDVTIEFWISSEEIYVFFLLNIATLTLFLTRNCSPCVLIKNFMAHKTIIKCLTNEVDVTIRHIKSIQFLSWLWTVDPKMLFSMADLKETSMKREQALYVAPIVTKYPVC